MLVLGAKMRTGEEVVLGVELLKAALVSVPFRFEKVSLFGAKV
jgi:hypothetical protein